MRSGRGRRALEAFVVILAAIVLFAVFGDRGLVDLWRLRGERDRILATNGRLRKENGRLRREISLLRGNRRYIGEVARDELGMIGRGEVIYRFDEPAR